MEEYVDVLNENGENIGEVIPKKEAHKKGICHRVSVVIIIDADGKLLLQKRAMNKATEPGKWDLSAAGHVDAGETSEEAAIRETYEEIGIKPKKDELEKVLSYKYVYKISEDCIINHFTDLFLIRKDKIDIEKIKMQESEVSEIKMFGLKEYKELLENGETVEGTKYCTEIMKFMK